MSAYHFKFPGGVSYTVSSITPHAVTFAGSEAEMLDLARQMEAAAMDIRKLVDPQVVRPAYEKAPK